MDKTILCLFITLLLFSCKSTETIIFSSSRAGNSDIYQMKSDGSQLKQLTKQQTEEWGPTVISSNEITFLRQEGKKFKRIKLNIQTGEESPIAQPKECVLDDKNVIYGPKSGKQLYQCKGNIFVADPDGSNTINLTQDLGGNSFKASWYPDETRITFTNDQTGDKEIYAIDMDRSNLTNLTNLPNSNEEAGEISPDGSFLLFSSNRDGNRNQELYIMNLQTKSLENITNTPDWELIGRWSSDGKRIYFGSNKDGNWELYRYTLSNKQTTRLTNDEGFDGDPRVVKN